MHRYLLPALVAAATGATGFAAGWAASDDSATVRSLEARSEKLATERDRETDRADQLASQLDSQDEEITGLEDALAKAEEKSASEPSASKASTGQGLKTLALGQPGKVGQYEITPTSFARMSANGDTAIYQAVVSVKNNASDSISPFCGDDGAELVDAKGRTFDPESVLDDDSNNCEDVQPGLTLSNFKLAFKVPASAKPRILRLWGDYDNEALPQIWSVK